MSSGEHASAAAPERYEPPISPEVADELARKVRAETEDLIHVSTSSGSSGDCRLHVPANPDGQDTETACSGPHSWREPSRKPVECFPVGWLPWCTLCAIETLEELERPPGIPLQAIPDGGDT